MRYEKRTVLDEERGHEMNHTHCRFGLIVGIALLGVSLAMPQVALAQTTVQFQVADGNDDAEEELGNGNGNIRRGSSRLEMVEDSFTQIVGIRFVNVTIPQGATILSAQLDFTTSRTGDAATSLTISGEAVDDPEFFRTADYNISSRATTAAAASWTPSAWNSVGERHLSSEISAVVQEIVNRSGWASGNAMAFMITGSGKRVAVSRFQRWRPPAAPILHVTTTVGAARHRRPKIHQPAEDPPPANQPPVADAGPDQTVTDSDDDGAETVKPRRQRQHGLRWLDRQLRMGRGRQRPQHRCGS